jgi:hypothetical protein
MVAKDLQCVQETKKHMQKDGIEYLATRIKLMNEYTVTFDGTWRPLTMAQARTSARSTAPTKTKQFTFSGKTKSDVYSYIKYYSEHYGMLDIKLITEGYTNEEKPQQQKASGASKKASRKKRSKKR